MTQQVPVVLLAVKDPQAAELVAFLLESDNLKAVTVHDGMQEIGRAHV